MTSQNVRLARDDGQWQASVQHRGETIVGESESFSGVFRDLSERIEQVEAGDA